MLKAEIRLLTCFVLTVAVLTLTSQGQAEDCPPPEAPIWANVLWPSVSTFTTSMLGMDADADGNIWVAGLTSTALPGQEHVGGHDAFVALVHADGEVLWHHQFGTEMNDRASDLARDMDGNIYIVGGTWGAFPGSENLGQDDAFLAKFDASGELIWLRQFGTELRDAARNIVVDAGGNVYVSGHYNGNDLFLARFNAEGDQLWLTHFGTPGLNQAWGLAYVSPGAIYVAGEPGFVARFNHQGKMLWHRTVPVPGGIFIRGLAAQGSAIYVTGHSSGSFPGFDFPTHDVHPFIIRYNPGGKIVWLDQFDFGHNRDAAIDSEGNVYLSGHVTCGSSYWLARYTPTGNQVWRTHSTVEGFHNGRGTAVDPFDRVIVTGSTSGKAFIAKWDGCGQSSAATGQGDPLIANDVVWWLDAASRGDSDLADLNGDGVVDAHDLLLILGR